mgnify:FL=1
MFGRSTILFPIIVLLVLTAITIVIESKVKAPLHRSKASLRHDPDYYLENFVTTKTDAKGNLKTMLAAVTMLHYPDDDSTYLTRPRFTQYSENKPYTQIEGQKGEISKDGEQVDFTNNVIVYRPAFGERPDMRLTTDYLRIFAKQEIAKTDSPVFITQGPKTIIRGTGMIYDKTQQTFTLLKNVKVHYEKPAPIKVEAPNKKEGTNTTSKSSDKDNSAQQRNKLGKQSTEQKKKKR